MVRRRLQSPSGFTLTELLLVVAVIFIVIAMAIPLSLTMTEQMRVENGLREVERELQNARLRAVAVNQRVRVRFDCPSLGFYRTLQVMGTAVDTAANRCNDTAYPWPAPQDGNPGTPDYDGPVRFVLQGATLAGLGDNGSLTALEFRPDGQVFEFSGGSTEPETIDPAGINLTLTRGTHSATVNVNALGRIRITPTQ